MDVVEDLHEIVITVAASELGLEMKDVEIRKLGLMLVGASIGAPVARLYAHFHPGKVAGMCLTFFSCFSFPFLISRPGEQFSLKQIEHLLFTSDSLAQFPFILLFENPPT